MGQAPSSRRKDYPNVVTLSARCTGFEPDAHYIVSWLPRVPFIQEALMILKRVFAAAAIGAMALVWSGASIADEYRADDFLGLDLSTAVLSPKPLGPAASFTPGPLDVTVDRENNRVHVDARPPAATPKVVVRSARAAHPRADQMRHVTQPRLLARTKLAHHHGNPLDAQAFDTRVQVWPCKSGGICNWRQ
jgi:hypothetical protein